MAQNNDGFIDEILRRWAGILNGAAILFTIGWGIYATFKAPGIVATYFEVKKRGNYHETKYWEWRASSICFGIYAYWIFMLTFFFDGVNLYWPTITGVLFGFKYGQHEHGLSVWFDAMIIAILAILMRKAADHFGKYDMEGIFRKNGCYVLEDELAAIEAERALVDVTDVDYADKMAEFDRRAEQMKYIYS